MWSYEQIEETVLDIMEDNCTVGIDVEKEVLMYLNEFPGSIKDLAEHCTEVNFSTTTEEIHAALCRLRDMGLVRMQRDGNWRIVAQAKEAMKTAYQRLNDEVNDLIERSRKREVGLKEPWSKWVCGKGFVN